MVLYLHINLRKQPFGWPLSGYIQNGWAFGGFGSNNMLTYAIATPAHSAISDGAWGYFVWPIRLGFADAKWKLEIVSYMNLCWTLVCSRNRDSLRGLVDSTLAVLHRNQFTYEDWLVLLAMNYCRFYIGNKECRSIRPRIKFGCQPWCWS